MSKVCSLNVQRTNLHVLLRLPIFSADVWKCLPGAKLQPKEYYTCFCAIRSASTVLPTPVCNLHASLDIRIPYLLQLIKEAIQWNLNCFSVWPSKDSSLFLLVQMYSRCQKWLDICHLHEIQ